MDKSFKKQNSETCVKCGSLLTKTSKSFLITDHISKYIKDKISDQLDSERCYFDVTSCDPCQSKIQKLTRERDKLKDEIEKIEKNESLKEELQKKENKINSLKKNPSDQLGINEIKFIKKHQKWFYNEFSGNHLRKKMTNLDHLKESKPKNKGETSKESDSLLGEATKFVLVSKKQDKKFLVKQSKDSNQRNDHGIKELVTEKIMTDIASHFMKSAKCSLGFYRMQPVVYSTFFSYYGEKCKYEHEVYHGDDIFRKTVQNPPKVRSKQKNFYKLEKIEESILKYPENHKLDRSIGRELLSQFRLMLLVDSFIGNQDRHHQNWCFILKTLKEDKDKKELIFSPLFDTGRGLFWNSNIYEIITKYKKDREFKQYVDKSWPLFHIGDNLKANHFDVAKYIKEEDKSLFDSFQKRLHNFYIDKNIQSYSGLISPVRIVIIKKLLKCRKQILMGL